MMTHGTRVKVLYGPFADKEGIIVGYLWASGGWQVEFDDGNSAVIRPGWLEEAIK